MPYSKFPPSLPRGSRRNWEERLLLPTRLDLHVHGLVERQIATCGFLVWDVGENRLLMSHGRFVAEGARATPALAGHRALSEGLNWLIRQELHRRRIVAYTDSNSVFDHLVGSWPIRDSTLGPLVQETRKVVKHFPQLSLELISEKENQHAIQQAAAAYVAIQEERRRRRTAEVLRELFPAEPGHYLVGNRYKVDLEAGTCTCPDFRRMHTDEYPIRCKHLLAAEQLVKNDEGK